ncbi:MAG: hypothetical protein JWQ28_1585, partial [Pedobacter sp.]|nr:hypothetical protein [Pedobacter sp.]
MLSLENLRTVFGKCPETCLVMYPDAPRFTIAYANANYLEATNRTAVDIVGKGIFEAFPGTQVDLHKDSDIKTSLEQVLEHKSVHKSSLFRFNLPDQASSTNEPHFWISETYPLINDCGSIEYIVRSVQDVTQFVSAKDITTISKAEQQIEAHHQRIANILESVTDGFLALDRNFTVTYWNKEAERILCKSREEAMGENLWSLYPEAVHKKFYSEYHKALSENVSRQFQEYLDVVQCWLEVTAYPSEDGLSIFFKDISDRIAAEEQLKEANEQYQNLFDLSPAPNWVYDVETLAILDVNKASLDHYGYSKEEFLRMTLTDVRPTEDLTEFMNVINKEVKPFMVSGGSSDHIKLGRHKKKSGEIINVEVKGSNISFQGRVARLALIIDVTERMRSAHELSVSEQRFRALVQEGSDLIQIIDEHGFYKYVSPNAHRVLKRVFKVGDKAFASVVEPDKQDVLHALNKLQNGECTKLPRVRCRDMNNEIQWMEITLTNLMDDPAVNGIVSNSRNVTEQINSE